MNKGWKASDNSSVLNVVTIGNNNIELKAEPIGCWNISENTKDTNNVYVIYSLLLFIQSFFR